MNDILIYENSFKLIIDSILKKSKFPIELTQFDRKIKFTLKQLLYPGNANFIDPNINQALHHYLINTRGDFIKNLYTKNKNNTNSVNIGFLNNLVFSYIATSKSATNFLDVGIMQYKLVENSLISDRTLLGIINYQYLSKINYGFNADDIKNIHDAIKIKKFHEHESEIYTGMLKLAPDIIDQLINQKILPEEYNKLNKMQIIELYKTLIELSYDMSKNYSYQYDDLKFQLNERTKDSICQICYDIGLIKNGEHTEIELNCLVVNSEILEKIDLEGTKKYDLNEIINIIKNENEYFSVNLKEIEDAARIKNFKK